MALSKNPSTYLSYLKRFAEFWTRINRLQRIEHYGKMFVSESTLTA